MVLSDLERVIRTSLGGFSDRDGAAAGPGAASASAEVPATDGPHLRNGCERSIGI